MKRSPATKWWCLNHPWGDTWQQPSLSKINLRFHGQKIHLHCTQMKEVLLHSSQVLFEKNSLGVRYYITQDPFYPQDPSRKKSTHSPHRHWSVWLRQKWTAGLCDADHACFHSSPKRSVLPRPGAAIRSPAGWGLSVGQYIVRLSRFPLEARRDGEEASCKHRSII